MPSSFWMKGGSKNASFISFIYHRICLKKIYVVSDGATDGLQGSAKTVREVTEEAKIGAWKEDTVPHLDYEWCN